MNNKKEQYYQKVDLPFYRKYVTSILPPVILDFHAHVWQKNQWLELPEQTDENGAKYMVTELEYPVEQLLDDGNKIFADQKYETVCFGQPTPMVDTDLTNNYLARSVKHPGIYPLLITGKNMNNQDILKKQIDQEGFLGFKVFLDWIGNNYGDVCVENMIGQAEMNLADKLELVVLLHVPGAKRLADNRTQIYIKKLSNRYPGAQIVLAHCGRCYHPKEMRTAVSFLRNLDNVYLDTSMVMDPIVLQMVFENIDSKRVLFGTDFPVAVMRGRRVNVMDHWVDVVLKGYSSSKYRVASNDIHATFMAYEIVMAIKEAADRTGLTKDEIRAIFYNNGIEVLSRVKKGKQLDKIHLLWNR